uniref:Olfactory receptor family 6 subfamily C member 3 n=1 Tax=Nannospalax galili TaxID=1026970 RepID=A0A8C6QAV3_NANGA
MNLTVITEFILLGLSDDPDLQVVIFLFLLITYILSVTGNLTIIALTLVDSHLQTPMYFFLRNFSFLELLFTTVCRFLGAIVTRDYNNCAAQLFFFIFMGVCEFYILTAISYDRYVAICKIIVLPMSLITMTILRITSIIQRKKAFSTCSSHMIVISISYGSCIFMYANPSEKEKASLTKGVAILNTSVVPMLNPFIYTLRNQQVKQAFKDVVHRLVFSVSK